jgi:hypothetical protein
LLRLPRRWHEVVVTAEVDMPVVVSTAAALTSQAVELEVADSVVVAAELDSRLV